MSAPAAPERTIASCGTRGGLPLVDPSVLRELEIQLENPAAVRGFVKDFIDLWQGRYTRLVNSIGNRDQVAAHDAVLSLKIASMMIGAPRLAQLSVELEVTIRGLNLDAAGVTLKHVEESGKQTVHELLRAWNIKSSVDES